MTKLIAKEEKILVKVWNVKSKGRNIKVATIENRPRKPSVCKGCSAPCCRGMFRPILTSTEFLTKQFPVTFIPVPKWLKEKVPNAEYLACLAFKRSMCQYFDQKTNLCTIFPNCPEGCLAYDCREDPRPEIKEFIKKRIRNGHLSKL